MSSTRILAIYKTQGFLEQLANAEDSRLHVSESDPLTKAKLKHKLCVFHWGISDSNRALNRLAFLIRWLIPFRNPQPSIILVENGILKENLDDELARTLVRSRNGSLIVLAIPKLEKVETRIAAYQLGIHLVVVPNLQIQELKAQSDAIVKFRESAHPAWLRIIRVVSAPGLVLFGYFLSSIAPNFIDNWDSSWKTRVEATPEFVRDGEYHGWKKFHLVVTNERWTAKHGFTVEVPENLRQAGVMGISDLGRLHVGDTTRIEFWINTKNISETDLETVIQLIVLDPCGNVKIAKFDSRLARPPKLTNN